MTKKSRDRRVQARKGSKFTFTVNVPYMQVKDFDCLTVESYDGAETQIYHVDMLGQLGVPKGLGVVTSSFTGTNSNLIKTYKAIINSRTNKKHGDDSRK